jgi:hypothetical protein
MEMTMTAAATEQHTLDSILEQLNQYHQRATYGAVAGVVNSTPRSLMVGRDRNAESCWVVSRQNGQPTGYTEEQKHGSLTERDRIIGSPEELRIWLHDPS